MGETNDIKLRSNKSLTTWDIEELKRIKKNGIMKQLFGSVG